MFSQLLVQVDLAFEVERNNDLAVTILGPYSVENGLSKRQPL